MENSQSQAHIFKLSDVEMIFHLWLLGAVLSVITFLGELLYCAYKGNGSELTSESGHVATKNNDRLSIQTPINDN